MKTKTTHLTIHNHLRTMTDLDQRIKTASLQGKEHLQRKIEELDLLLESHRRLSQNGRLLKPLREVVVEIQTLRTRFHQQQSG